MTGSNLGNKSLDSHMKTEEIEARDRAEIHLTVSIPEGEFNREIEVDARPDGIVVDEYAVIPWEWLLRALARQSEAAPVQAGDSSLPTTHPR